MKKQLIKSVRYSNDEWEIIKQKAKKLNMKTGTYIQKISVEGKILIINSPEHQRILNELHKIGSNYNQIARRLNQTNSIYYDDIKDIKQEYEDLCHMLNIYLSTIQQQDI